MVLFLLFIFPALLQRQTETAKTIFFSSFKPIGNMFEVKGIIPGGLHSGACGLQVYMCRLQCLFRRRNGPAFFHTCNGAFSQ